MLLYPHPSVYPLLQSNLIWVLQPCGCGQANCATRAHPWSSCPWNCGDKTQVGLPADFTPMHTQPHQNSIPNQSLLSGIERRTWKAEGRTVGRCRHNNLPFKEHMCFFLFIIGNTKKEQHFFLGNAPMSRDIILEANFSRSYRADWVAVSSELI